MIYTTHSNKIHKETCLHISLATHLIHVDGPPFPSKARWCKMCFPEKHTYDYRKEDVRFSQWAERYE